MRKSLRTACLAEGAGTPVRARLGAYLNLAGEHAQHEFELFEAAIVLGHVEPSPELVPLWHLGAPNNHRRNLCRVTVAPGNHQGQLKDHALASLHGVTGEHANAFTAHVDGLAGDGFAVIYAYARVKVACEAWISTPVHAVGHVEES